MITRSKIDGWIRQVEATPVLAPILIRQITDRLLELDADNESLRAENLELSTGNKVKEFEQKIAELEFQLDLLKRQLGSAGSTLAPEDASLLVFNDKGQVLRLSLKDSDLHAQQPFAVITGIPHIQSRNFSMITVSAYDQLLLVTSSGRTVTVPVEQIALSKDNQPNWSTGYQVELPSQEELIWILPITRLHTFTDCIQVSRFGYGRKVTTQFFKTFIANHNLGKGTKFNFDRILNLTLCNDNQLLVLASKAGNFISLDTGSLPVSLTEIIKFKVSDYAVSSVLLGADQTLVGVTQNGFVFNQNQEGLKPGKPIKRKLAPSPEDEVEGSLVGAVPVGNQDLLILYREDGSLSAYPTDGITNRGSLLDENNSNCVLAIAVYPFPRTEAEEV